VPKLRLTLAALAFALASLRTLAPAAAATPAEQERIVELTNQARAANGLPAVSANAALNASAEAYSLSMATLNFFSHTGLDGSTFSSRNEAAGYTGWSWMGENIAAGQQSADEVFQAWMNSPGHRANILNAQAREIGVGHADGPASTYRHYWTMELGARAGVPGTTAPTATPTPPPAPTATPPPTATPTVAPRPVGPPGKYRVQLPSVTR
jgi:uncharacterized protein YkwD